MAKRRPAKLRGWATVRRNVEAGYYDATGFHPIRASRDYDADRAGDEYSTGRSTGRGAKKGKKKNPGTKAERAVKAQKKSAKRRVAVALAKYLKQENPGKKIVGAKVQKLKGGVIKITPIKANAAPQNGYVVYQSGRGYMSLREANKAAKEESKQYGFARVERTDNGKDVAKWRNGRRER